MKLTLCCFTNKTKKSKGDPCIKHILSQYFGSRCSVLAKFIVAVPFKSFPSPASLDKFQTLKHQHLDYSWKCSGFKSSLTFFLLFSTAPRLVSRNVKKWETDSHHLELNFILSFPVLSLSGFIFKGRDLCSLLGFKEQWMKCPFIFDFFNAWKSLFFCTFSMH